MNEVFSNVLKGIAMGAANVIPGVSGGTIALITGIFERLVASIKSFNFSALKLILTGKSRAFAEYTDLTFIVSVLVGIGISVLSFARLFDYLFKHCSTYVWSFFFGLILASVFYVGASIRKWNMSAVFMFIIGTGIAVFIAFGTPVSENSNIFYLVLCGGIGACSMILPGLSGSFVLLLMGNYELVMIDAVNLLTSQPFDALRVLLPVGIGAFVGLIAFSYVLSWVYTTFRDQTIGLLTGFVSGSLFTIWPWKETLFTTLSNGTEKIAGYRWLLPEMNRAFSLSLIFILLGMTVIVFTERLARRREDR